VPISGSLSDPRFDFGESVWTAVKNVVVNILAAPFRAIGRGLAGLFAAGKTVEEPKLDPVTFVAGSTALSQEMERHLTRVADFLRRAPYVRLELVPVATPRDAAALREQGLRLRLEAVQREKKLKDLPAALAVEFRERFPGAPLPDSQDAQLAQLIEREGPGFRASVRARPDSAKGSSK